MNTQAPMSRLQASVFLEKTKEKVLRVWEQKALEKIAPARLQNRLQLLDSLPHFIDQLISRLKSADPHSQTEDFGTVASNHGAKRASQPDYSLDEVISEFQLLHLTITEALESQDHLGNENKSDRPEFSRPRNQKSRGRIFETRTENELEASEQLRSSRQQLESAVKVAKVGFYDWDIANDRIVFSDQMQSDWGIAADTPLESVIQRLHSEDQARVTRLISQAMTDHTPYHTEYRVIRPNGREIIIEAKGEVTYDSDSKPLRFIGTSIDITERKQLEKDLIDANNGRNEESRRLVGLFDKAPFPLAILEGPEHRFTFANAQYSSYFLDDRPYLGKTVE